MGGVDGDGDEAGDDPWPRAHRVMGDVEPEGGAEGIFFVLGAEHSLGDVAAAAGFGAGIPAGPPLDGKIKREGNYWQRPESIRRPTEMEGRKEGEHGAGGFAGLTGDVIDVGELDFEESHAADFGYGDPG